LSQHASTYRDLAFKLLDAVLKLLNTEDITLCNRHHVRYKPKTELLSGLPKARWQGRANAGIATDQERGSSAPGAVSLRYEWRSCWLMPLRVAAAKRRETHGKRGWVKRLVTANLALFQHAITFLAELVENIVKGAGY
jgi:hypothetical protein